MDRNSPRILIVNTHSQANAGDHAIVLGQLQLLKKTFPAARVTVTSRTPALDRPALAAWGVEVIAPFFHSPAGFQDRWRGWLNAIISLVFPLPAWVFLRRLRMADLVFACGGGYFYSSKRIPGFTFWQNYLHIRLAIYFKKDTIFFPQSYGPLDNRLSRRLLAGLLASRFVRVVFAREDISMSILRELLPLAGKNKLRSCPDIAFYYSPPPDAAPDPFVLPRPRVALALRDWDFPAQKTAAARQRKKEEYLAGVLSACQLLHQKYNASFLVFSQSQGPSRIEDDRRVSMAFHERMQAFIPGSQLRWCAPAAISSPAAIIDWLRHADMLITSRMHAAIFAFLAGIPAVVIGYQHKSQGILHALGLEVCSLPIEDVQGETLFRLSADMLQNREQWLNNISRSVSGIRETIEAKFQGVFGGAE